MFGSIALFLFASLCVWGWILIWPINKSKNKGLKGWCYFTLIVLACISFCFSVDVFTANQPVTGDLIRSNFGLMFSDINYVFLWLTFLAGLIISFFDTYKGDSDKYGVGDYLGITFVGVLFTMIIGMAAIEFVYQLLLRPFLFPLFQALF
jgi:hypothetical protein